MAEREIVKKVDNAILYSDGCIRLDNVRASFPHLDKPYAKADPKTGVTPEKKFGLVGMLDKKTHVKAKDLCVEVINKLMKDADIKSIASDKKFIRNGNDMGREEYEGYFIASAREARRPTVRNRKGEVMTEAEILSTIYAGFVCFVLPPGSWSVSTSLVGPHGRTFSEGRVPV
ncbi:MAG: hypothetical protein ACTS5I_14345, partial [Rhodanobacter sp.]